MSTLYLIRHGQASFDADDYDALSPLGFEQARALGRMLAARAGAPREFAIVGGSLRRHRETADTCLAELGIATPMRIDPGFDEYDHLQLIARLEPRYADAAVMRTELAASGDPRRAFQQLFARACTRWYAGAHDADYDEAWPAFQARCTAALARVADSLPRGSDALVFTSGGPIAACCQSLLAVPTPAGFALSWTLYNAGITRLNLGREGLRLLSLNEHSHLEAAPDLLSFR